MLSLTRITSFPLYPKMDTARRTAGLLRFVLVLATLLFASGARAQEQSAPFAEPWLSELAAQLSAHFLPEGELTLEWARPRPASAAVPMELEILNFPASLAPQLVLHVRAAGEHGTEKHNLIVRAQLWRDGYIMREPAVRNEPVLTSALETVRYDALRDRDVVGASDDLDLIYTRSVPSGRLLTWRDVGRRPLVRRGQLIEVAASDGALVVTLRGIALADAGRGEIVRVRNPDSRKEFSAQVVAEARALVSF